MVPRFITTLLSSLLVLSICGAASAQAFIEQVFPPYLKRGETTRLRLVGSDLERTRHLWTTLPKDVLSIKQIGKSSAEEAVFEIRTSDKAPLGLFGLRVATIDGLSNVHVFAIDDLPRVVEREYDSDESNNQSSQAEAVALPAALIGSCAGSDVDHYVIDVKAGQRVAFEIVGNRLGKGFDPVLTIVDSQGKYVTDRDNDVGLFFDFRFAHTFEKAGRYTLRLQDTRYQGSLHWTYMLRMGDFPIARVALPSTSSPGSATTLRFPQISAAREVTFPQGRLADRFYYALRGAGHDSPAWLSLTLSDLPNDLESEPNDTPEQATTVQAPGNMHGVFGRGSDWDHFAFELKKGQRMVVRADTRAMGSAADLELTLFSPSGKQIKQVDDVGFEDATFEFTAAENGRHVLKALEVVRKGGPEYAYRIEIRERSPKLTLRSEIGRIAIPQGARQPLPLQIGRSDFKGPVQFKLIGAPRGMRLTNSSAAAEVSQFDGLLEVDTSVPAGVYSLQVEARAKAGDRELTAVARTQPLVDRVPTGRGPHGEPFELREDQRRLPPSLTDRIAVVVLPPTPFDFQVVTDEVILPRYVRAEFVLETRRRKGFDQEIRFAARGGMLEKVRLQPVSVTSEIPVGGPKESRIVGVLRSGVQTPLQRHRVTVTGAAEIDGRTINLTRIFYLQTKVAFAPTVEPAKIELTRGGKGKIRIAANRLPPFDGAVKIRPAKVAGVQLPETIEIPAGSPSVEVDLKVDDDVKPGALKVAFSAATRIGKFSEETGAGSLQVVIGAVKDKAEDKNAKDAAEKAKSN